MKKRLNNISVTMRSTFQVVIALSLALLLITGGCVIPATTHLKQGDSHAKQGLIEEAIGEYSQAIEFNPNLPAAYKGMGLAYFDQGQWSLAITDLNKAIELDHRFATDLSPKLAVAYSNRGHDYTAQGLYDLAIDDLTKAIELDPASATAGIYAERGKACLETGYNAEARNNYNKAIELDPQILSGQELADILYRGSSKVTTVSTYLDSSTLLMMTEYFSYSSVIIPIKVNSMIDYTNKKMRMDISIGTDSENSPNYRKPESLANMFIVDGSAYIYTKAAKSAIWIKKELNNVTWDDQDQLSAQMELLKSATDVACLGSEKIDGVDCYKLLLFKPDAFALSREFQVINLQRQKSGIDFGNVDLSKLIKGIEVKEWITKDGYLPVKVDLVINLTSASDIQYPRSSLASKYDWSSAMVTMQFKFTDFNKPVSIELPAEASAGPAK